ncbi:MAG: hypothetical protein ACI9XO_001519, partial [Paraglaciecola sp.]
MRKISADWVFPVSDAPIQNGVITVDHHGKIVKTDHRDQHADADLEIYSGV